MAAITSGDSCVIGVSPWPRASIQCRYMNWKSRVSSQLSICVEDGAERLDGDGLDVPHEVGVATGPAEVGVDARRVRRVVDAGGEGEVLVDAGLLGGFVHQPGRSGREERCSGRAERDGRAVVSVGTVVAPSVRGGFGGAGRLRGRRALGVVAARAAGDDRCGRAGTGDQEPATIEEEPAAARDGSSPDCIVATVESHRTIRPVRQITV